MKARYVSLVLVIVLVAGSWLMLNRNIRQKNSEYKFYLSEAQRLDEEGYYVEAIDNYKEAQKIKNDIALEKAIIKDYYRLGEFGEYESRINELINTAEGDEELNVELVSYYMESGSEEKALNCVRKGLEKFPDSEQLDEEYKRIRGNYEEEASSFLDFSSYRQGYARVYDGESYGMIDAGGTAKIELGIYSRLSNFGSDMLVAGDKDGTFRYYDSSGRLRLSPETIYDEMDGFHSGYALVSKEGRWGYIDTEFKECSLEYDAASSFYDGVAAVCKDGKWALIDTSLETVTDFIYEDIKMDAYRSCSVAKRIFAKVAGSYQMLDEKGNVIAEGFDDAKCFVADEGSAAICRDGKWGAVNINGEIVLACEYEETASADEPYVPYRKNNLWGYVTMNGESLIEPKFEEAQAVNEDGYAPVRENGYWHLIRLLIYRA